MKRVIVLCLIGAGAAMLAGCTRNAATDMDVNVNTNETAVTGANDVSTDAGTDATDAADSATVTVSNFNYGPSTVRIKAGGTVTWNNQDSMGHTATADDGSFDGNLPGNGGTYSKTFDKPGTYTYYCKPHPNMKGTVIVE